MKNSLPLISIIIPIYNSVRFLKKCLDSVVNQTYSNIEIVLVNDGSTDNSGKLCDDYASKDSRIVVIHRENQGVAQTRNVGIAVARGEYIMFVDSDDWVDTDICEILINAVVKYKVQSAMCSYIREYPDKSLPKILHSEDVIFSGRDVQRRLCGPVGNDLRYPENLDCYNAMWGKLYPSVALKGTDVIDLSLLGSSEDLLFNLTVFSNIESMVYVNQTSYHYRKNVSNSITSTYKFDLEAKWGNLYCRIMEIIEANQMDEIYYSALNNRIALNVLGVGLNCVNGNIKIYDKYKILKKATADAKRKNALKELPLRCMPLHWKVFFFFAKYNLNLLLFALLVVIKNLKGKM